MATAATRAHALHEAERRGDSEYGAVDDVRNNPDRLHASVFTAGQKRRMNVVPIFLNVFMPWGVFCGFLCLFTYKFYYLHPGFAWLIFVVGLIAVLGILVLSLWSQKKEVNPMWYKMMTVLYLQAIIVGTAVGLINHHMYMFGYFQNTDLTSYVGSDPSVLRGMDLLDAGRVYWANGVNLDLTRSWHFKHDDTYCVAPIVKKANGKAVPPTTHSYDFWAVGVNCCNLDASDFRCGDWANIKARSSLRLMDPYQRPFFRLAVEQAETLYNMVGTQPVFFSWEVNPLDTLNDMRDHATRITIFAMITGLCYQFILVVCVTWRFAYIGRSKRNWDKEHLDGDVDLDGPASREHRAHDI